MCIYTHIHNVCPPHPQTPHPHIHTACAIYTNITHTTPHTKHKGINSRHRPPHSPPYHIHTMHTHTPCTHTHTQHIHTTPRKTIPTHIQMLQHTPRDHASHPQIHNITHTTCTAHQAPMCKRLPPPHCVTPTLTHSYNIHITESTATHPHTFPFSLSCSGS